MYHSNYKMEIFSCQSSYPRICPFPKITYFFVVRASCPQSLSYAQAIRSSICLAASSPRISTPFAESRSQITGNASSAIFRILFSFRRSRSISGSVILFFLASIISFWFSSIIYACLTEPAGFSLIPRTFFPIPTAPEDTTIISFPLEWLLIPFRFSPFQFIFLVGINKRSRKRVYGDTFFCFFFHYRIIILQWLNKTYHFFIPSEMNILSCIYWIHAFPDLQYWIFCSVPLKDTVDAGM